MKSEQILRRVLLRLKLHLNILRDVDEEKMRLVRPVCDFSLIFSLLPLPPDLLRAPPQT